MTRFDDLIMFNEQKRIRYVSDLDAPHRGHRCLPSNSVNNVLSAHLQNALVSSREFSAGLPKCLSAPVNGLASKGQLESTWAVFTEICNV